MRARVYQPAKTAMSSGQAKTKGWVLEHAPDSAREIDPLMGWTSSDDTQSQVKLRFDTKEAALDYAREKGIEVTVTEPKKRKVNIRPGGYGDNFATNRRTVWTH
ncbi:ETC complex I subunit [Dinoroseobacter sp. S375]|uniref:ETC complex I subunit n=1 Tax=Dinoroseobacter sp. S375 TaxID=3415136 RepID=UPI003C7975F3